MLSAGTQNSSTIIIGGNAVVTLPAFPKSLGPSSTATVYFNGGTLQPSVSSTNYLGGVTSAFIQTGGANLAIPGGINITIAQPLQTDPVYTGGGLTLAGSGVLALAGPNTYTGGSMVTGGVLDYQNLAAQPSAGTTTVANGATLALGVSNGGSPYYSSTAVDALFTNTLPNVSMGTSSGVGIDTTAGASFIYGTSVSGAMSLAKLGSNTLTLTGNNTYTGGTSIWAGVLDYYNLSAIGTGAVTFAGNSTLQAGVVGTLANNIALNSGAIGTFDTQSYAVTLSGVVSGPGGLEKISGGLLTLTGSNVYTGSTTINSGTLQIGGGEVWAAAIMPGRSPTTPPWPTPPTPRRRFPACSAARAH